MSPKKVPSDVFTDNDKLLQKLIEIARKKLNNNSLTLDSSKFDHSSYNECYQEGLDDGEIALARYILHSLRIHWN